MAHPATQKILILGGARSGKSSRALEYSAMDRHKGLRDHIFVATATASDEEMAQRIARHKADRGPHWSLIEEPVQISTVISRASRQDSLVLVDCLTLWLSRLLIAKEDVETHTANLENAVRNAPGPVILVSNEVGWGIVPASDLGRAFRDAQGLLNQRMAKVCDRVELVVAGLPVIIKAGGVEP